MPVAGLRSATLLKRRLRHRCFPVNFIKFLRTPFLQNTNVLTFLIFYLLYSSFFFSGFAFYKEALCLIIFILSLCSNMLNLENILEYIHQKLKKDAHFKISSQEEVFTRLFFFFSSQDEISSLSFIPG